MCNKIPIIPKSERAIYNRLVVFPFLSIWCMDAPLDPAEQFRQRRFPMDRKFEKKIPKMASAFLYVLVQGYARYCRDGLKRPKVVDEYTKKYWDETDPYNLFREDRIELVLIPNSVTPENPNGIVDSRMGIEIQEMYALFISWFQDNLPGVRLPQRPTVIDELRRRWGEPVEGRWIGIRVKEGSAY